MPCLPVCRMLRGAWNPDPGSLPEADKQFPTRIGSGETEALWTSGTAGAKFGPWWAVANEALANTPDIEYVAVAGPVNSKGEFNYMTGAPTGSVSVVSKECKHPEAAIIALAANNEIARKQEELENVLDKAFERISRFHRELFTIRFGKNVYIEYSFVSTKGVL